jgi:hypothetical protein
MEEHARSMAKIRERQRCAIDNMAQVTQGECSYQLYNPNDLR